MTRSENVNVTNVFEIVTSLTVVLRKGHGDVRSLSMRVREKVDFFM